MANSKFKFCLTVNTSCLQHILLNNDFAFLPFGVKFERKNANNLEVAIAK